MLTHAQLISVHHQLFGLVTVLGLNNLHVCGWVTLLKIVVLLTVSHFT